MFDDTWKPISREEREAIKNRAVPGLEEKLAKRLVNQNLDPDREIASEIGTERMRFQHDPETAAAWVEENRARIITWLAGLEPSRRKMVIDGNRWMGIA